MIDEGFNFAVKEDVQRVMINDDWCFTATFVHKAG